jgi:hypothetical protein
VRPMAFAWCSSLSAIWIPSSLQSVLQEDRSLLKIVPETSPVGTVDSGEGQEGTSA